LIVKTIIRIIKTRRIKLILVIVVMLFTSIAASVVVINYYPGTLGMNAERRREGDSECIFLYLVVP